MGITERIRSRSREGWKQYFHQHVEEKRSWARRNGEKALLAGLLAGVLCVLAFNLIKWALFLGAVALFVGWKIALPESVHRSQAPGSGERDISDAEIVPDESMQQ
jgi:hypothetical protein